MLVEYIREAVPFDHYTKGTPIGCVVAIDKDHIGWCLAHSKKKFNRKLALEVATGRAMYGTVGKIPNRAVYVRDERDVAHIEDVLQESLIKMQARADKYFK